ncbi:MAG: flagellar biosynthesis protein FliQ [Candidatus Poriferisodalaceae bacterium]|jgi:flagellar biosynthesis protein FliQ
MDEQTVVEIATDAMLVGAKLAGPILIVSLVIGVIVVGGPWMLEVITTWVTQLWGSIPGLV